MKPEIQTAACFEKVLNFLVSLCLTEGIVNFKEHKLRDIQPESPCHLTTDQFGDKSSHAMPRSPEFDDVKKIVVSFSESRKRTALAERLQVTCQFLRSHLSSVFDSVELRVIGCLLGGKLDAVATEQCVN